LKFFLITGRQGLFLTARPENGPRDGGGAAWRPKKAPDGESFRLFDERKSEKSWPTKDSLK
jgi:hypothetical protein